jgi:hypothetical protein
VAHEALKLPTHCSSQCRYPERYMSKTIAGFFRTRADGETAQDKLLASGFTREEVSFIAGDTGGHGANVLNSGNNERHGRSVFATRHCS